MDPNVYLPHAFVLVVLVVFVAAGMFGLALGRAAANGDRLMEEQLDRRAQEK